jgi:hypothetical protein
MIITFGLEVVKITDFITNLLKRVQNTSLMTYFMLYLFSRRHEVYHSISYLLVRLDRSIIVYRTCLSVWIGLDHLDTTFVVNAFQPQHGMGY